MPLKTASAVLSESVSDIFNVLGELAVYRRKDSAEIGSATVIESTEASVAAGLIESSVAQKRRVFALHILELPELPKYGDQIQWNGDWYDIDNPKLFDDGFEVRVLVVPQL